MINYFKLLAVFLLLSCSVFADDKLVDHPTIKKMHAVNEQIRKDNKLKSQNLSNELTDAAQNHAWYMSKMHDRGEEDFNHRGGNGTPGQRASKFCYEGIVKENIGRGYSSIKDVFEAWLTSDTHKDAIFSDTNDVGFGYAIAKDGTTYWVTVYGKPKMATVLIRSK